MASPLTIGTGNSKTGPSWSLPNIVTCPGRTKLCESLCYASTGLMRMHQGKGNAYDRKLRACLNLLKIGPEELALAIISQVKKQKLKTLRIHDSGDFFSPMYVRAWIMACAALPDVRFWFYTRSWRVPGDPTGKRTMLENLRELASLKNVAGWVSADNDCYLAAIAESKASQWAGIAFMETERDTDIPKLIQGHTGKARYINFALHGNGGKHIVEPTNEVRQCPAIVGTIGLDAKNPACIKCGLCLPTMAKGV